MAADFSRHHRPHHLLVANEAGEVCLVDGSPPEVGVGAPVSRELHAYANPIFDLRWGGLNDSLYALAVADMHVYVHDAASQAVQQCLGHHASSIRTVRFRPRHPHLLVTAGRDGCIGMWDLRVCGTNSARNSPALLISDAHQQPPSAGTLSRRARREGTGSNNNNGTTATTSVTAVEFMPLADHLIASIGQPDYAIKFWDIRYTWGRHCLPTPLASIPAPATGRRQRAFISLAVDSVGSSLYAVSSDNHIYRYLATGAFSPTPLDVYGHSEFRTLGSFYIQCALSPDDRYLLVGSTERHAYIWPTAKGSRELIRLAEHRFEVSAVAWSPDDTIFVGGEDYVSRLWWRHRHNQQAITAVDQFAQAELLVLPTTTVPPKPGRRRPKPALSDHHSPPSLSPPSLLPPWPHRSTAADQGVSADSRKTPPPTLALSRRPMAQLSNQCSPAGRLRQGRLDSFLLTRTAPSKRAMAVTPWGDGDNAPSSISNNCPPSDRHATDENDGQVPSPYHL